MLPQALCAPGKAEKKMSVVMVDLTSGFGEHGQTCGGSFSSRCA
jgi:hypothetical protein